MNACRRSLVIVGALWLSCLQCLSGSAVAQTASHMFWHNDVSRHIARHVRHPDWGRCEGRVGMTAIRFIIDRSGRVLEAHIARSSGIQDLDKEAVAALHRASPVPPMPDFVPGQRHRFELPMTFYSTCRKGAS
jgi:periplasmic protein TonB